LTELSVVIPLDDARGDAIEHLRTWTHGQTLERDRYQLVLVSDGEDPAGDRMIAELLQPQDDLTTLPGAGVVDLWHEGVRRSECEWLLISENHVEADPETLERALAGIREEPELDAASIEHAHLIPTPIGELGARWFDEVYDEWYSPGAWRRLNLAGYVIRREAYESAGGLVTSVGLFAAPLLSARLAEGGARLGHLPDVRIHHVQVSEISEHHGHSANYARGECEARRSLDPEFAERYFGHQHLVWNRHGLDPALARRTLRALAREALRELPRHPAQAAELLGEIRTRLPVALAGSRPGLALARRRLAVEERIASSQRIPRERRFAAFLRGQDLAVRAAQLGWITERSDGDGARLGAGETRIEDAGEGAVIGTHGLESAGRRAFRWSEPVLTVRLEPAAAQRELRIDTGGLRGSPVAGLIGAYADGRPLSGIRADGDHLMVRVPPGAAELTLLLRRLRAPGDDRRLGLPIFSLELEGESVASSARPPAVPQPAG
jgi:hypothetical protein